MGESCFLARLLIDVHKCFMCAWEEYISAYYRTLRWRFFCTLCWRGNICSRVWPEIDVRCLSRLFLFSLSSKTVFQALLKFTMQLKLTMNFWQFCFYLLSAESPSVCTCMCVYAWSMGWNETQGFMHTRHSASLSPSILSFEEASLTAPRPQQLARLGGQESLFSFSWQRNHGRLSLYLDLKHICVHVRMCLRHRHEG